MLIIRLILSFGIGFCLGNASRIGAEVRRRGSWTQHDADECFCFILTAFSGAIPFTVSFFL